MAVWELDMNSNLIISSIEVVLSSHAGYLMAVFFTICSINTILITTFYENLIYCVQTSVYLETNVLKYFFLNIF